MTTDDPRDQARDQARDDAPARTHAPLSPRAILALQEQLADLWRARWVRREQGRGTLPL